jgi:hypothetical protein
MQSRRKAVVGVNPITTKNNAIVTSHLDDEECDSEQFASHGELHGDDASGLHQVAPTPLSVRLVFAGSSSSLPRFLKMEYGIRLMAVPSSTSILEIDFLLM